MAQSAVYKSNQNARVSKDAREIGPLPPVKNPANRERSRNDLKWHLEYYHPEAFPLAWSEDHLKVIIATQTAIVDGGLFALGMPRGSGKTTIAVRAAIWAIIHGYRDFLCVVGASNPAAEILVDAIKSELRFNDRLAEDFPEVCIPFRELCGEPRKCRGQLLDGNNTSTEWGKKMVVFPTVGEQHGSKCCGSVITVRGITSQIRGQQRTKKDGSVIRPSLFLIDDPQTRDSAHSYGQIVKRMQIVTADILGSAKPGVKMSAMATCTIIKRGDVADQLLDRKRCPEWHGVTTKMVYEFPASEKMWDEYRLLRAEELAFGGDGSQATQWYRERQEEMDRGAKIAWPERHDPDELSAIQHAMNLLFRNSEAFFAEYQNEPIDPEKTDEALLKSDQIYMRTNNIDRNVVPVGCSMVTSFIDVQKKMLWYAVVAWKEDFTGYVIDYGAWPDQQMHYYTLSGAKRTIQTEIPGKTPEEETFIALKTLTDELASKEYLRDGNGSPIRIDKILIDANWGEHSDTVYNMCRQSDHRSLLMPSHGRGIGVRNKAMADFEKRENERIGHHWRTGRSAGRPVGHVVVDTNYWKSFVQSRLSVTPGAKGSLTLYGNKPHAHKMIADHLCAERRVRATIETDGRTVDEWTLKPGKPDNHLQDAIVGCCVAASMLGATISAETVRKSVKRLTLEEMRANARKLQK